MECQNRISPNLKIGVLIVTYNRKKLLEQCIFAVKNQSFTYFDLYIVDNASTDGTKEVVQKEKLLDSRIHYLNTGKNMGGAGGFFYGIKSLALKGYERFWIMDDDTIPEENALEKLLAADVLLKGNYGFLSSYVTWVDNAPCTMNKPQICDDWVGHLEYMEEGLIPIKRATFVSLFLNINTVKRFGLPIKEFFIWGDDWEYTDRISDGERKNFFVMQSKVQHKTKNNVGSDLSNDSSDRIDRYFYSFRNELYLAKRHGWGAMGYYFYRAVGTIKAILRNRCNKKTKRIVIVIKGIGSGIFFRPTIEYLTKE